ncbi:MAG: phenylalanine--tRNA ligase subunit alpha [Spirochaetales bacterium]|nr:phenylalanine--tRNA ligase subunit alpha [Spirochaetales bacterium]
MDTASIISTLHPLEVKVLLSFGQNTLITSALLMDKLQYNIGQSNQAISWLEQKNILKEKSRRTVISYTLTGLGHDYRQKGTPEERIVSLIEKEKELSLPEIASKLGLENKDVGSAFGLLSKNGVLEMNEAKKAVIRDIAKLAVITPIKDLLEFCAQKESVVEDELPAGLVAAAKEHGKKRGAASGILKMSERDVVEYAFTNTYPATVAALKDSGLTGDEIGTLTPDIIRSGDWRKKGFRSYNINTAPVRVLLGRKSPYVDFLDKLKDQLTSLGFEEYDGPLVETEFWNSDALFMPQFHPARDIHDVYYIKEPTHAKEIDEPFLSNVASTHENGWKTGSRGWCYKFDRNFTKKLILRSQGTVLSAKALTTAKIPGKYFGVARCFRYDKVDATHLADFYQTEGIVLGDSVNLKTLLGLLKMFAEEVAGAKEVKYVPAYFPFTEPSVEVHIKHPILGWFELGGAGIFRPEVTKPLGIDVPVLAWGLGIDRMALMSLGLKDLRDLFSFDIEEVRLRRRS